MDKGNMENEQLFTITEALQSVIHVIIKVHSGFSLIEKQDLLEASRTADMMSQPHPFQMVCKVFSSHYKAHFG